MNISLRKFRSNGSKSSVAQQLVEFLLVAPLMIIILGILLEYAYALSINMTLAQGLKQSTSIIYGQIKPAMTQAEITTLVQNELVSYLANNNVPVGDASVQCLIADDIALFNATYTYTPAFTLPNVYIHVLPETFNFQAFSVVPSAFLKTNTYDAISSATLDQFWASGSSFSSLDDFTASKSGIMRLSPNDATVGTLDPKTNTLKMVFLYNPTAQSVNGSPMTLYEIIKWDGTNYSPAPATTPYYANVTDGNIYAYDIASATFNPVPISSISTELSSFLTIVIFNEAPWATNCNSAQEYALDTQICVNKAMISLTNAAGSQGNYDNIPKTGSAYSAYTFGSRTIVHPSATSVSSLMSATPVSLDLAFGTKVAAP